MGKKRIHLTKETLLIPLYSKAMEGSKACPIMLGDKAHEILSMIDYDFNDLKIKISDFYL